MCIFNLSKRVFWAIAACAKKCNYAVLILLNQFLSLAYRLLFFAQAQIPIINAKTLSARQKQSLTLQNHNKCGRWVGVCYCFAQIDIDSIHFYNLGVGTRHNHEVFVRFLRENICNFNECQSAQYIIFILKCRRQGMPAHWLQVESCRVGFKSGGKARWMHCSQWVQWTLTQTARLKRASK